VYSKRILIVDDEQTLVFFLCRGLSEAGLNCEVDGASSGEEALAKLAFDKYQVLITDLKMPGINGITLAAAARSLQPTIGIILMTAFGSREVETEAEQLMVDGYLTKPFQMERLRDLVEGILSPSLSSGPLGSGTASPSARPLGGVHPPTGIIS
jgi:DNA-binding response OmpR family regulator